MDRLHGHRAHRLVELCLLGLELRGEGFDLADAGGERAQVRGRGLEDVGRLFEVPAAVGLERGGRARAATSCATSMRTSFLTGCAAFVASSVARHSTTIGCGKNAAAQSARRSVTAALSPWDRAEQRTRDDDGERLRQVIGAAQLSATGVLQSQYLLLDGQRTTLVLAEVAAPRVTDCPDLETLERRARRARKAV